MENNSYIDYAFHSGNENVRQNCVLQVGEK